MMTIQKPLRSSAHRLRLQKERKSGRKSGRKRVREADFVPLLNRIQFNDGASNQKMIEKHVSIIHLIIFCA